MMDLRYHLASLMSVFLALGVGIVVGISLGSSERQAATIQSLQRDVAAIRAEDSRLKEVNGELHRRLEDRETVEKGLLPLAVHGRLAGNRVALILTGDTAQELAAPVTEALRLSGADVLTLRLPRGANVAAGSDAGPAAGTEAEAAATLTRALLAGRPALLEEVRTRLPDLEVTGELRGPIRRMLLLCPNDQPDYARRVAAGGGVEATLARGVQDAAGALLVAAEPEGEPDTGRGAALDSSRARGAASLLPALAALGASTVDNVETTAGQIAVVLALAGASGRFGTGPGASQLLPAITRSEGRGGGEEKSSPSPHPSPAHSSR